MVEKLKKLRSAYSVFDLYIFFSLVTASALWLSFYYYEENFIINSFFESTLLVGTFTFFTKQYGHTEEYTKFKGLPILFFLQTICFIGISFKNHTLSGLYLGLIPCVVGTMYFLYKDNKTQKSSERKGLFLYLMGGCTFLVFGAIKDLDFISYREGSLFLIFSLWSIGLVYFSNEHILRGQKGLVELILKKGTSNSSKDDRLFFHDLINHTHGLSLFINNKMRNDEGIPKDETYLLANEIKMIQSLVKDHYGFKHKDLLTTYDEVSFDFAKVGLMNLIDNFLPASRVNCHLQFLGHINSSVSFDKRQRCTIYYPSFYRIMNNIIKNIAEANSSEVEFVFDYQDDGLHIIIKNKISALNDEKRNELDESLGKIILMEKTEKSEGLGLESITQIISEIGGSFNFKIENGLWINEIFIPKGEHTYSKKAS